MMSQLYGAIPSAPGVTDPRDLRQNNILIIFLIGTGERSKTYPRFWLRL